MVHTQWWQTWIKMCLFVLSFPTYKFSSFIIQYISRAALLYSSIKFITISTRYSSIILIFIFSVRYTFPTDSSQSELASSSLIYFVSRWVVGLILSGLLSSLTFTVVRSVISVLVWCKHVTQDSRLNLKVFSVVSLYKYFCLFVNCLELEVDQ